jgi:pimeloyl-ACP methyl ester carboxylesterase
MRAEINAPITEGVCEERFVSPLDSSSQTYLIAESKTAADNDPPFLVVYLHGALSHQEQGMTAGIYDNFFGRWWSWLKERNVRYVCPEYRGNSWMGPAAEADIVELIRLMRERYRPIQVILTGGSMGGTSALIFASRHPELLDGALALCPATDTSEMFPHFADHFLQSYGGPPDKIPDVYRERSSRYHADMLVKLPLVIVHGSADALIPIHHARLLVEQLQARNARLQYIELKDGGHDSPVKVDLRECMEFLLNARK